MDDLSYSICGHAEGYGPTVLVLQGGGALGAYQAGAYQALHEAGMEPDWVIGTSIGAINAALIAGNPVRQRVAALREFWDRMSPGLASSPWEAAMAALALPFAQWNIVTRGIPAFFSPNLAAFISPDKLLGVEQAGYYSTAALRQTLEGLTGCDSLGGHGTRLTVGVAGVASGDMHYFDSRDEKLSVSHIVASGALPPAFPAVVIDGAAYWDGGILSNTPLEAVFDDRDRHSALVFSVNVWQGAGPEPASVNQIAARLKDIQFASRTQTQVLRQQQIHRLRHVIAELTGHLPAEMLKSPEMRELAGYGCLTRMHVMELQAPRLPGETSYKDIDFSRDGIAARWQAGYADTARAIERAAWKEACDAMEGLVLHRAEG